MRIATTSVHAGLAMTCISARGAVDDERQAVVSPPYGDITKAIVEADPLSARCSMLPWGA